MRTDFPFTEDWTWRKGVKKEAKIVGVTTRDQLKMRECSLKREGKEPGILPNYLDLIGEVRCSRKNKALGVNLLGIETPKWEIHLGPLQKKEPTNPKTWLGSNRKGGKQGHNIQISAKRRVVMNKASSLYKGTKLTNSSYSGISQSNVGASP